MRFVRPVGCPVPHIILSEEERSKLQELSRLRKTGQGMALRAQIVLACAAGFTNGEVAEKQAIGLHTVGKWRRRFARNRLAGLSDAPRPGQPRKITDTQVEQVVTRTLETMPTEATH